MCGRSLDNLIEKFPQLDFCCCGCRLSTGVKILGWMGVFYGVVIEIVLLAACVQMNIQTRNDPKSTDSDKEAVLIATVIGGSVATLFIVLITLLSVMLLIGVYKNDVMKVRCWLRVNVFFFALGLFFAALGLITVLFTNPIAIIGQLIVLFINFGISFYFISVVKSHYTEQMAAFERVTNS